LGNLLARAMPLDESFDAIVPVPLYWRRRLVRGFNQADLLSRGLAKRTGIPVLRALRRVHRTATQAGLSNSARRRNVSGAFEARSVAGLRILLIDDVMTTGSTGASCAMALKRAGARRVALLTIARVDRRMESWRLAASNSEVGGESHDAD